MDSFTVFPAIDLRQVVRLQEGVAEKQTTYSSNPGEVAERWLQSGSRWLHVVNLDGAFSEKDTANKLALDAIIETAKAHQARIQYGGGIRSLKTVETLLSNGVSRVILGTLAIEKPEVVAELVGIYGPERIAVSLDGRDGVVHVQGWRTRSKTTVVSHAELLEKSGLKWLVFTDIRRDGRLTGINLDETARLVKSTHLNVIASGGVSVIGDIIAARNAGLAGVITGKALYEGAFDPKELFALNVS